MARKPKGVRVTLYMPDELRKRAKAANVNLSRVLREAVERELSGDAPQPPVDIKRVGNAVEIRASVPVDALRKLTR